MPKTSRLVLIISSLAAAAALTLAACGGGGGSSDSAAKSLAEFMPADTAVYVQGNLKPDSDIQTKTDDIAKKLTGTTIGETLQEAIASSDKGVDFKTDVEPWLGDNAAMSMGADLLSGSSSSSSAKGETGESPVTYDSPIGGVVETSDASAAQSFIDKQAKPEGGGEYEGVTYSVLKSDDTVAGILDDHFVAASDEAGFKAMVDAQKGDSLEDNKGFSEVVDKIDEGSLVNVYVGGTAATAEASAGADYSGLYKAFGVDPEMAGAMFSLVPAENEISIRGYAADQPDLEGGDASELIAGFPANTVFAMGTSNLGENATKTIETLDKDGIPGMLKPGQLGQSIDQISEQGIDVRSLIKNLNDLGLFVQGDSLQNLGGALVLTSSDLDSVRSSFKTITGLIRLAGAGDGVKPLGGGMTGLSVRTPELPGRPVIFAVGEDRIVIAIGMPAARQALKGSGADLGSTENFKAAKDSVDGALAMYADPATLTKLIESSGAVDSETAQFNEILAKFSFMAAGTGSDEGSGELNLGLKE